MSRISTNGDSGFTLIEVLVSLTILSIALAVLFQVLGTSLDRLKQGESEAVALSLTQSLLTEAGQTLPLSIGDTSGAFPNGFHWRLHIEPYGSDDDHRAWPYAAVLVSASTLWDGDREAVTLTSLRLTAKDSPR